MFVQHYDTTALDASVLLMPLLRFLPAEDPRIRDTVLAIADELTVDELVLRYKVEETDDGFQGEEGTFTICSFWLVSALVEIGELARARSSARAAVLRQPPPAVRRGARPPQRPPPWQLPAGLHPPRPINAVVHVIGAESGGDATRFRRRPSRCCNPPEKSVRASRLTVALLACVMIAACAGSPQPDPPASGPPVGEATSSSGMGARGHPQPLRGDPVTRPPVTRPPVTWRVGARPLPPRPDGFGEVQPTPAPLRARRLPTVDRLPPPPGGRFRSSVARISPAVRARIRATWKPGCPVGLADLAMSP